MYQTSIFKIPIILSIILVLAFGVFCAGMINHSSMEPDTMAYESSHMLTIVEYKSCCDNSISKHINYLGNTSLLVQSGVRGVLIFLAWIFALGFGFKILLLQNIFKNQKLLLYKLHRKRNLDLTLFNYLRLAFARGIINPKVF